MQQNGATSRQIEHLFGYPKFLLPKQLRHLAVPSLPLARHILPNRLRRYGFRPGLPRRPEAKLPSARPELLPTFWRYRPASSAASRRAIQPRSAAAIGHLPACPPKSSEKCSLTLPLGPPSPTQSALSFACPVALPPLRPRTRCGHKLGHEMTCIPFPVASAEYSAHPLTFPLVRRAVRSPCRLPSFQHSLRHSAKDSDSQPRKAPSRKRLPRWPFRPCTDRPMVGRHPHQSPPEKSAHSSSRATSFERSAGSRADPTEPW